MMTFVAGAFSVLLPVDVLPAAHSSQAHRAYFCGVPRRRSRSPCVPRAMCASAFLQSDVVRFLSTLGLDLVSSVTIHP